MDFIEQVCVENCKINQIIDKVEKTCTSCKETFIKSENKCIKNCIDPRTINNEFNDNECIPCYESNIKWLVLDDKCVQKCNFELYEIIKEGEFEVCALKRENEKTEEELCLDLCQNDGICFLDESNEPKCKCPENFHGKKCDLTEEKLLRFFLF